MKVALRIVAALAAFAASMLSAEAHHRPQDGPIRGVPIPAITHGEMLVIEKYRTAILDVAVRQPLTDPAFRRLSSFVNLQYFACFRGLVPGSLWDEESPFNECAHAYLAGTRALLVHMAAMPGDQQAASALLARIDADIAGDPAAAAICANSAQVFDSASIVPPDWAMVASHPPTILTFSATMLFAAGAFAALFLILLRRGRPMDGLSK